MRSIAFAAICLVCCGCTVHCIKCGSAEDCQNLANIFDRAPSIQSSALQKQLLSNREARALNSLKALASLLRIHPAAAWQSTFPGHSRSLSCSHAGMRTRDGSQLEMSADAPGQGKVAAVIGATGFVGSHIVKYLLGRGYTVRGSARDPAGSSWLHEMVSGGTGDQLTMHSLELGGDATERDEQLDTLLEGADAVFFCAGFERQEPATIDFMVNSAVATIDSARRKKVGSVVLTSSGGSTNPPGLTNETPKREHEHWSDPELQKSKGRWSPAAKTLMEINALKAVGRNQQDEIVDTALAEDAPRLCIMNPNLILGTQLKPGSITGNSLPWVLSILKGEKMKEKIPNDSMSIIDVRDLAALHVACVERSDASGRYFGVNRSFPWEEILAAFKAAYSKYSIPPRFEGSAATPTQFDCSRRDSLQVPLRGLEDTVKDLVDFFIARGDLS